MNGLAFLQLLLFVLLLSALHELGHIVAASLLKLHIQRIGLSLKPYPHAYVAVKWTESSLKRYLYLFSGSAITVMLFFVALFLNFFNNKTLYLAFTLQLIIETNPFYSDFTLAIAANRQASRPAKPYVEGYSEGFASYPFSLKWYFHMLLWALLIITMVKIKNYIL